MLDKIDFKQKILGREKNGCILKIMYKYLVCMCMVYLK